MQTATCCAAPSLVRLLHTATAYPLGLLMSPRSRRPSIRFSLNRTLSWLLCRSNNPFFLRRFASPLVFCKGPPPKAPTRLPSHPPVHHGPPQPTPLTWGLCPARLLSSRLVSFCRAPEPTSTRIPPRLDSPNCSLPFRPLQKPKINTNLDLAATFPFPPTPVVII